MFSGHPCAALERRTHDGRANRRRHDFGLTSRRRFLREGGALVGGAVMAGSLAGGEALAASDSADNLPPNVPEWMKTPGDPMGSQPYGTPSPFEKGVVKNIPKDLPQYLSASGRTPLQDLDGIITPNGLFYERHHGGVPTIDPAQHRLMLHGLVDKPLIFTMDDIRRFPSQSHIYFLECSGNPGLQEALRQDGIRPRRSLELCRMDRRQPEARSAGSGIAAGREMGRRRRRGCRRDDAQHSDRKMSRRRDAGIQPERRAAASAARLSAAAAAAGLRGQHERKVAAPPARRRGADLFARRDIEIHRPDAGRHRRASSRSTWKRNPSSRGPRAASG